jgi:hypothetical protein
MNDRRPNRLYGSFLGILDGIGTNSGSERSFAPQPSHDSQTALRDPFFHFLTGGRAH